MAKRDMDPVRGCGLCGFPLEELEARLEKQAFSAELTGVWQCNPVNACNFDCGGGALCAVHCPCDLNS